jgi:RNA polymerase sigma-70 factor, ECF subfamily
VQIGFAPPGLNPPEWTLRSASDNLFQLFALLETTNEEKAVPTLLQAERPLALVIFSRAGMIGAKNADDPDNVLLRQARAGNRNAFDTLRRVHDAHLRGFVIRRVGTEGTDDILQETWLACWTGLKQYRGRSRFKAWLYGIAAHKCTDYLRRRAVNAQHEELLRTDFTSSRDDFRDVERRQTVQQVLECLPDTQREVVELYYFAELTLAEIADILGRNLNTVKYQFYRAHDQVAAQLQAEDGVSS